MPPETKVEWTYEKVVLMFNKWVAEHGADQVGFTVACYLVEGYDRKDMASVIFEGCLPLGTTPKEWIEAMGWSGKEGTLNDDGDGFEAAMAWFEKEL